MNKLNHTRTLGLESLASTALKRSKNTLRWGSQRHQKPITGNSGLKLPLGALKLQKWLCKSQTVLPQRLLN